MNLSGGPFSAVIFDCDGVLVDSEGITNRLLRDDLAQRELDLTLEQVVSTFVGGTMEAVAEEAVRLGAKLSEDWVDRFYVKMFAALETGVEAVPGVAHLLDRLAQAGAACAVGSNGPRAKMEITLRRTGLWNQLSPHIYSARELEHPKPSPDVYLFAARQLEVAPENCVVVEDSITGARAAQAAGMRCIGFAQTSQQAELTRYCDAVAADMATVARLLNV